jgi:hypothetical protein
MVEGQARFPAGHRCIFEDLPVHGTPELVSRRRRKVGARGGCRDRAHRAAGVRIGTEVSTRHRSGPCAVSAGMLSTPSEDSGDPVEVLATPGGGNAAGWRGVFAARCFAHVHRWRARTSDDVSPSPARSRPKTTELRPRCPRGAVGSHVPPTVANLGGDPRAGNRGGRLDQRCRWRGSGRCEAEVQSRPSGRAVAAGTSIGTPSGRRDRPRGQTAGRARWRPRASAPNRGPDPPFAGPELGTIRPSGRRPYFASARAARLRVDISHRSCSDGGVGASTGERPDRPPTCRPPPGGRHAGAAPDAVGSTAPEAARGRRW